MPLPDKSDPDCVGKTIKIEMASGKPKNQATAIGLNHCGKSKKKDKKNEDAEDKIEKMLESLDKDLDDIYSFRSYLSSIKEIMKYPSLGEAYTKIKEKVQNDMSKLENIQFEKLSKDVCNEIENLKRLDVELAKQKKWIQGAKLKEGAFTSWCKNNGFSGPTAECIAKAKKAGGHAAKMANLAATFKKMN